MYLTVAAKLRVEHATAPAKLMIFYFPQLTGGGRFQQLVDADKPVALAFQGMDQVRQLIIEFFRATWVRTDVAQQDKSIQSVFIFLFISQYRFHDGLIINVPM